MSRMRLKTDCISYMDTDKFQFFGDFTQPNRITKADTVYQSGVGFAYFAAEKMKKTALTALIEE